MLQGETFHDHHWTHYLLDHTASLSLVLGSLLVHRLAFLLFLFKLARFSAYIVFSAGEYVIVFYTAMYSFIGWWEFYHVRIMLNATFEDSMEDSRDVNAKTLNQHLIAPDSNGTVVRGANENV